MKIKIKNNAFLILLTCLIQFPIYASWKSSKECAANASKMNAQCVANASKVNAQNEMYPNIVSFPYGAHSHPKNSQELTHLFNGGTLYGRLYLRNFLGNLGGIVEYISEENGTAALYNSVYPNPPSTIGFPVFHLIKEFKNEQEMKEWQKQEYAKKHSPQVPNSGTPEK